MFSLRKRVASTNHAFRGIGIFLKDTHNAWMQLALAAVAVYLGWALRVSTVEWCLIIICIFGVLVTEAINTAIEVHVNLTNPEIHPHARDTKDVAAGAVLLTALGAGIVGACIFVPKLLPLLSNLLS